MRYLQTVTKAVAFILVVWSLVYVVVVGTDREAVVAQKRAESNRPAALQVLQMVAADSEAIAAHNSLHSGR